MDNLTASIVLTTIFDPVVLEDYYENLKKYNRLKDVDIYLIPDLKTPDTAYKRCFRLKDIGLKIHIPDINEQKDYLRKVGFSPHLIPYNSDNRRNIGFLMVLESGSDMIVSIDDDNYCRLDEDFIGGHGVVCKKACKFKIVETDTGWYNNIDQLEMSSETKTYPRGFPYYFRHKPEKKTIYDKTATVSMNAGLWLNDPDVDGISWLVNPSKALSFKGESFTLSNNTWCPVNTQNTSMQREVMSCYYYLKMKYPMAGFDIDRFGDIYSGYFAQACVKSMGHYLKIGDPVAIHKRNSHNFFNDAANEWAGIMILEDLLPWLTKELKLTGKNYPETYECLSECLQEQVEKFSGTIWTDSVKAYFHQMAFYMRQWAAVCRRLI